MITEARFRVVLKDMMKKLPLSEINVLGLCERCGCHRQTFYYHYQDIYDLLAEIFLHEELPELDAAQDGLGVMLGLRDYVVENYSFLVASFDSAARELTEDFLKGKAENKFIALWAKPDKPIGLRKEGARHVAKMMARLLVEEFCTHFRDPKGNKEKLYRKTRPTIVDLDHYVFPALVEMCKKEEAR